MYRLALRSQRLGWIENVVLGALIPIAFVFVVAPQVDAGHGRLRLLLGNVLLALVMLILRRIALAMSFERSTGAYHLLETTHLTVGRYVGAYGITAVTLALLPLLALLACVLLVEVPRPQSAAWLLPYALSLAVAFGLALAAFSLTASPVAAGLAGNAIVSVTLAFCPVLYPLERVPVALVPMVTWLPFTLAAELMDAAWSGGSVGGPSLALLAAWAVGFLWVGLGLFARASRAPSLGG